MKTVLLFSGGYDSVAALDVALKDMKAEVICLFVDYGQPYAAQEYAAASYAFKHYENLRYAVEFRFADLQLDLIGTDYVPHRNLILASLAANIATANGCDFILTGSKSVEVRPDDSHSFIDSSKPFYNRLSELIDFATEPGHPRPHIGGPVMGWSKTEILKRVHGAGLELQLLWSCYEGADNLPCRKCHACQMVREALVEAGLDQTYAHMLKVAA